MNFETFLFSWGWSPYFQEQWNSLVEKSNLPFVVPGRVVTHEGSKCKIITPEGLWSGLVSGRLAHSWNDQLLVGDWCAVEPVDQSLGVIHDVLPRKTQLARSQGRAGQVCLQAANIDRLGIVTALDHDFSVRRAQRLTTLAATGGMEPLWFLTKADLPGSEEKIAQARELCQGIPLVVLSTLAGTGLADLKSHMNPGETLALVGSSGTGKSTLLNALADDDLQKTTEVRQADSKGRHTTTARRIYLVQGDFLVMDTPGIRSVGLWADQGDLAEAFPEITRLAESCRFTDCGHQDEPGCAVRLSLEQGELSPVLWESWLKQKKELEWLADRNVMSSTRREREKWKKISQFQKRWKKEH